jgi:hypothetical protein
MENWTDKRIKRSVEELIEESYLLSLSDAEIQRYLQSFIEVCEKSLLQTVKKDRNQKIIEIRIALLKANLLLGINSFSSKKKQGAQEPDKSSHDIFAEQVVETKGLILSRIEEYDAGIAEMIIERNREYPPLFHRNQNHRTKLHNFLAEFGYLTLLGMTVLLIWIVLFY